ncbi:MAG: hypothetical protein DRJ40_07060 [Thermoprotei archaeon]|nr:MAG: hypothetical protein DRJ40_07060 [Thermoprotei archaeon]
MRTSAAARSEVLSKLAVIVIALVILPTLMAYSAPQPVSKSTTYIFRDVIVVENRGGRVVSLSDIQLNYVNVPSGFYGQKVKLIKVYVNGSEVKYYWGRDIDGNPVAFFERDLELRPGTTVNVTVIMEIEVPVNKSIPEVNYDGGFVTEIPEEYMNYTVATSLWNYSDPIFSKYVLEVKERGDVMEIITCVLKWIESTFCYETHMPPLKPSEVVKRGAGDCDELANVMITVLRSAGIPAFLEVGAVYLPSPRPIREIFAEGHVVLYLCNVSWHAWVVAYTPRWGWVPIDLTYFRGSHIESSGSGIRIRSTNILDHINGAAVRSSHVIAFTRVTVTDYIEEYLKQRRFLIENSIYITEYQRLTIKKVTREPLPQYYYVLAISTLAVLATFLSLNLWKRSRPLKKNLTKSSVNSIVNCSVDHIEEECTPI